MYFLFSFVHGIIRTSVEIQMRAFRFQIWYDMFTFNPARFLINIQRRTQLIIFLFSFITQEPHCNLGFCRHQYIIYNLCKFLANKNYSSPYFTNVSSHKMLHDFKLSCNHVHWNASDFAYSTEQLFLLFLLSFSFFLSYFPMFTSTREHNLQQISTPLMISAFIPPRWYIGTSQGNDWMCFNGISYHLEYACLQFSIDNYLLQTLGSLGWALTEYGDSLQSPMSTAGLKNKFIQCSFFCERYSNRVQIDRGVGVEPPPPQSSNPTILVKILTPTE